MAGLETYEKCPRCGSLSSETELSTSNRVTRCTSCGYEGGIAKFQEHKHYEIPKNKPNDLFGRQLLDAEQDSYKQSMLKRLDIQS